MYDTRIFIYSSTSMISISLLFLFILISSRLNTTSIFCIFFSIIFIIYYGYAKIVITNNDIYFRFGFSRYKNTFNNIEEIKIINEKYFPILEHRINGTYIFGDRGGKFRSNFKRIVYTAGKSEQYLFIKFSDSDMILPIGKYGIPINIASSIIQKTKK